MTTTDVSTTFARHALQEDAPEGDLTSALVIPPAPRCAAELRCNENGVLAGTAAAQAVFEEAAGREAEGDLSVAWFLRDGQPVRGGSVLARIEGPAKALLLAERVAINLLGHLSGVATLTRRFVEAAAPATVLCTRKTTPGLRALEREAVLAGGGVLHRASLSDGVLIKDNHLAIVGDVATAVHRARAGGLTVEVEVESLDELDSALAAGADRILLDNATPALVAQAVERIGDPERLEVSGGVSLDGVGELVAAGARLVSVGRLTHSAPALDLSLEIVDD